MEVFAPNAHTVEPMDPNNVNWDNPIQSALKLNPMYQLVQSTSLTLPSFLGTLTQEDPASIAFILFMGFVVMISVLLVAKKMKLLGDSFSSNKGLRRIFTPAQVSKYIYD